MKKEVSHKGRVVEVGQDVIQVEIISSSACSSCHAAGLYHVRGSEENCGGAGGFEPEMLCRRGSGTGASGGDRNEGSVAGLCHSIAHIAYFMRIFVVRKHE